MDMTFRLTAMQLRKYCGYASWSALACAAALSIFHPLVSIAAPVATSVGASNSKEIQQYCANIAASVEALKIERRQKQLAELEQQITARLAALETKQNELRAILDRLDAFERKSSESVVGLYSRMKPEAAAAQMAELDDEVAAAVMLQLKTKISSAILGEMAPARGAALVSKIAQLRAAKDGKKP